MQNILKLTKTNSSDTLFQKMAFLQQRLLGTSNKKFNNTCDSMNKLIKDWQERKKVDCVSSAAEEFEDLVSQQESNILQTFLGVSSPYIIRNEYLHLAIMLNTEFSNSRKKGIFKKKLNVIVDEKCYRSILNYTPEKQAIERARNNVATNFNRSTLVEPFQVGVSNDSASNEQVDTQFQNETENDAFRKETEIKGNISYNSAAIEIREYSKSHSYRM